MTVWPNPACVAGVLALALALASVAGIARAAPPPDPDITLAARETLDLWRNTSGGRAVGDTTLNKLQLSGTWTANRWDAPGFHLHFQVFQTSGAPLTAKSGDLQTASNIEASNAGRLFELWAEQGFDTAGGKVAVRAGLIDLNSDFDSIDPAALFLNSSHGIGPDLSRSGRNGPSIFPVSAAAVRVTWAPSDDWTVRTAVFDGVPGAPDHPKAFAAVRLSGADGALAVGEVDRKLGPDAQVSLGAWRYTAALPTLDGRGQDRDAGAFAYLEGAVPGAKGLKGWVRAGTGDPSVQVIGRYLGSGLVWTGPFASRPDDRLGVAVANAVVSPQARRLLGLRHDETTFEGSYQIKVRETLALQPDVQYIVHPSTQAGLHNALLVGFRVVLTAGFPKKGKATEASDPTVPPDGTQPPTPDPSTPG